MTIFQRFSNQKMHPNRRKTSRKPISIDARVSFGSGFHRVKICDISECGLSLDLVSNGNVAKQFTTEENGIEISVPKILGRTHILGQRAWIKLENGFTRVGVRFNQPDRHLRQTVRRYLTEPSAARYTIGLYQVEWRRNVICSLLSIFRDVFLSLLPFRLPRQIIQLLYGIEPGFAFYVHPRRKEDIFVSFPLLGYLRNLLPPKWLYTIASSLPPFVIGTVQHPKQSGVVIATLQMPGRLMKDIKYCVKKARGTVRLAAKICPPNSVLGLGAWWPMATRRGLALKSVGDRYGIRITNGHCGTLVSVCLMIEKIAQISGLPIKDLHIGIIGVGKMGKNVALALNGKVRKLTLIDINQKRLDFVVQTLRYSESRSELTAVAVDLREPGNLQNAFRQPHLFVCTTSNIRRLFSEHLLPERFVVIDDSRPEAFFRTNSSSGKIVLEGGLMKLKGSKINYDYGFGIDENVFGCLAESFCLGLDKGRTLLPTVGQVDMENFSRMMKFCRHQDLPVGDFKSASLLIKNEDIAEVIKEKQTEPSFT